MPNVVGSRDYQPFSIYARGEKRPFDLGGEEPVVFGSLRLAPIAADGTVTMSAEALRDLCNHVYREGWQFGERVSLAGLPALRDGIEILADLVSDHGSDRLAVCTEVAYLDPEETDPVRAVLAWLRTSAEAEKAGGG